VFVKICGITRIDDALAAVEAGAGAIGLNFVAASVRCVDHSAARSILGVVPEHVMTVGVFRGHPPAEILEITSSLGLDAAQLHGDEPPEFTARVASGVATVIKAVSATSPTVRTLDEHAADIVMLDALEPGGGVPFDWSLVGDLVEQHRILLTGGLRPDNVEAAIRQVRPWGVDVASGVESAPGRKDPGAVARFVTAAR
jgi:phosphoribosylanthranilate isomerase